MWQGDVTEMAKEFASERTQLEPVRTRGAPEAQDRTHQTKRDDDEKTGHKRPKADEVQHQAESPEQGNRDGAHACDTVMANTPFRPKTIGGKRQASIATVNVGGSRDLLRELYAANWDIIMIQEHKCNSAESETQKIAALAWGWNSVWQPAKSAKCIGEGGVAILVKGQHPVFIGNGIYSHRWMRATVPWTRTRALHLFCVYGHDVGKNEAYEQNLLLIGEIQEEKARIGRVPTVMGGDWNCEPMTLNALWDGNARIMSTGQATHRYGRELDYFVINGELEVHGVHLDEKWSWNGDHRAVILRLAEITNPARKMIWAKHTTLRFTKQEKAEGKWDYLPTLQGDLDERYKQWRHNTSAWLFQKKSCGGHCERAFAGNGTSPNQRYLCSPSGQGR